MQDYSDLLFLIGAIAIYGLLVSNTNNTMLRNNQMLTTTEMEYGAVSVAQNVIEQARWISYDDATKDKLEGVAVDENYTIEVDINPITLNGSDKNNKKIDIKVFNSALNSTEESVTMSYIKTQRK